MSRREIPIENYEQETPIWQHGVASELEALMRSLPNNDAEDTIFDGIPLREAVADAVESLEPRKRYVIESVFYGRRMSFRRLGAEMALSKSQVFRIHEEALSELRILLTQKELGS